MRRAVLLNDTVDCVHLSGRRFASDRFRGFRDDRSSRGSRVLVLRLRGSALMKQITKNEAIKMSDGDKRSVLAVVVT